MQKLSSLLYATLFGISILAHESMAQTSAAPSKTGTRLITLGTAAGPTLLADRAQSSNLVIVNGTHYVIDAGDRVASRIAQSVSAFGTLGLFSLPTITTITQLVLVRCYLWRGINSAPNRSMSMARPGQLSWSRPPCSIAPSALRSGLPTEVAPCR
jgi:hypothetical protein